MPSSTSSAPSPRSRCWASTRSRRRPWPPGPVRCAPPTASCPIPRRPPSACSRDVPTYGRATTVELTTPTGAALLAALSTSFGPMPAMVVSASGFGGGAGELDELPNCTQVIIGQRDGQADIGPGQPALLLETNLDDVTGEQLGHAVSAALEAGAFDAWVSCGDHEEGSAGPRPARPHRRGAPRLAAPRHRRLHRDVRGARHPGRALARRPHHRRGHH